MEEIKNEIEEEEDKRWITILLIIGNLIIWTIIMLFISIAKVDALSIDYNSGANYIHKKTPPAEFIQFGRGEDFSLNSIYIYDKVNIQWTNYQGGVADIAIEMKLNSVTLATYSCSEIYKMFSVVENGQDTGAIYRKKSCAISGNEIRLNLYWRTTLIGGSSHYMEVQLNKEFMGATVINAFGVMTVNSIDPATNTDIQDQTNALINNNNSNTQIITNAVENSTTNIINQMQDNLNLCQTNNYTNEPIGTTGAYLNNLGQEVTQGASNWRISKYIEIKKNGTYKINSNYQSNYCLYKTDKTLINCSYYINGETNITPTENGFIRYNLIMTSDRTINFNGRYCQDRTQAEIEELKVLQSLMHTTPWEEIEPDSEEFDKTHEMENDILDMAEDIDLDDVEVDLDTESSNWVWATLTTLLNTHEKVFGMVISILSVGIIKLLLNR